MKRPQLRTRTGVVVVHTCYVTPRAEPPHFEVSMRLAADPGTDGEPFLTRDCQLYRQALDAEGTDRAFTARWYAGRRAHGATCRVLTALTPAQESAS
jgi:hypothetical protein